MAAIAGDAGRIYLFNNAPLDPALALVLSDYPAVVMLDAGSNLGVGVGLNFIALAASRGNSFLMLLDPTARPWPSSSTRIRPLSIRRDAAIGITPLAAGSE